MFTWNHIDWGENINRGLTNNGFPFCEIEIKGWNDNQNYSDLEKLIAIKVIKTPLFTKVKVNYLHPDARNNFCARKLANETKKYLIHTLKN
ncbi:hypothetical protein QWY14_02320 [Planococcus sp. N028]|uniref:Uncharacterized protein n=1 Tax=Planococcus shixiaomingii TaxID=3058393 RepID=A0ABT8MY84_9BACL|nr:MULTISPECIES: hypothetical protein [unclassified Planococcus (in: firmicutes)]MDN7240602.1 hypothetical protein [Planococcus sp. N028]WKA56491.1 hypothetical protein QWY21_09130 [Planococcus sp. N022]